MQQNISKLVSVVAGLMFALVAASAFAEGPMSSPAAPGPMMGDFGGHTAVRCEQVHPLMQRHDMWGRGGDMWKGPMMRHHSRDRMMMGLGMLHALKLTDEQRNKASDIMHKARMENWKTQGEIMDAQYKMRKLFRADQPDPGKVGDAYTQIAKFKREMLETRIRARNEVWNLLTKEQQQQVHDWKQGHWQMHDHGMGGEHGMK